MISQCEKEIILEAIRSQLGAHGARIYFFGSRIKGTDRPGSDLDVLIDCDEGLSSPKKIKIQEILEESDLPYAVQLVVKEELYPPYREEILQSARLIELKKF